MIQRFKAWLKEATASKGVTFTFGRMNPPTAGHSKVIDKVKSIASKEGTKARIYVSQTQDRKKNPLSWKDKISFLTKVFPKAGIQKDKAIRTPFDVLGALDDEGISKVRMVVGSDRVQEFKKNMEKFINKDLKNIKDFDVVSAGERDPDADGVSGISASKMREFVKKDDFKSFQKGLPDGTNSKMAKDIFNKVKSGLNEDINNKNDFKEYDDGLD